MLAVVNKPHIEMCISGDDNDVEKLIGVLKKTYEITVIVGNRESEKNDDDEELIDVFESDWWKNNATPGRLLAGTRMKHELTQKQLAKLTGISYATISAYEQGRRPLTQRAAIRLAKAMNEDPDGFFRHVPPENLKKAKVN